MNGEMMTKAEIYDEIDKTSTMRRLALERGNDVLWNEMNTRYWTLKRVLGEDE